MQGKTIVITGASAGLGAAAARELAARGASVAVVGRSPEKTSAVARSIGAEHFLADFSRLADVRKLADQLLDRYPSIDILANNAGGQFVSYEITEDGHEMTFQVNHLAPFLLTHLLLDRLSASGSGQVISTSSQSHAMARIDLDDLDNAKREYKPMRAYSTSKLANVLFTRELAKRFAQTSVSATAFHPGAVSSDFFRDTSLMGTLMNSRLGRAARISPEKGAEPLVRLATTTDPASLNGQYYNRLKPQNPKGRATDPELAARLWVRSTELVGP